MNTSYNKSGRAHSAKGFVILIFSSAGGWIFASLMGPVKLSLFVSASLQEKHKAAREIACSSQLCAFDKCKFVAIMPCVILKRDAEPLLSWAEGAQRSGGDSG
jgi:hypothetical protein